MTSPAQLFRTLAAFAACTIGAALPMGSFAQATTDHDHGHASAASAASLTEGEVRKVDLAASKVTIRHGEIKNLAMPAMTMVFAVRDKALLNAVKPGDRVRFLAQSEGGKLIATDLRPLR